jgi:hypothetical protein
MAFLATTHFGALQKKKPDVLKWTQPVLDAYLSGCWTLHWTDDTLFWVAKPTVHVEKIPNGRRLHNDRYAALESDVENVYFWHGVLVPAFVVVRPDWITLKHIETEDNAEVRRVMIERFGTAKYVRESGADLVHELPDSYYVKGLQGAKLYRKARPNDSDIVMIHVKNSTPEPDGSIKDYFLRVQPDSYDGAASKDCHAAMTSTWRNKDMSLYFKNPHAYAPIFES